jgi:hypothetical protein
MEERSKIREMLAGLDDNARKALVEELAALTPPRVGIDLSEITPQRLASDKEFGKRVWAEMQAVMRGEV